MERFNINAKKNEQIGWLSSQGFKPGDILQQGCYEPMKITWFKEYKCYGLKGDKWDCFHFFGDLYMPEKCNNMSAMEDCSHE